MSTEKVLEVLKAAGKALKAGEIAEAAQLEKKEVDKAMKNSRRREDHLTKKVLLGTFKMKNSRK